MTKLAQLAFALTCLAVLASCGGRHSSPASANRLTETPASPPAIAGQDDDWAHRRWLEKVVRTLRAGDGFAADEDVEAWLKLPREAVVKRLESDKRFADMVLSFNLAFFGIRKDRIRMENGDYEDAVYHLPQAIAAARTILQGGDYLSLLDLYQPPFTGPLPRPRTPDLSDDERDPMVVRNEQFAKLKRELEALVAKARGPKPASPRALCRDFKHYDQRNLIFTLGLPRYFAGGLMMGPHWFGMVTKLCRPGTGATPARLADAIEKVIAKNDLLWKKIAQIEPSLHHPADVTQIPVLDPSGLDPDFRFNQLNFLSPGTVINSNTNFNRKRGNYFLKRYFCDNLTPVGVEMPAQHASGRHASDPACMSCHYKLDPMGGFFRYYGMGYTDFFGKKEIIFDDKVKADLETYVANWKNPPGSAREWNVGYIRSLRNEKLNDYGDKLEDLFAIFRRAPEVKHCIVQRLYEYLVSDTQAVDGDYLDYLTDQFTEGLKRDSAQAVKDLVANIVLSRSFSTPDPKPSECYDYRPGFVPSPDRPPCQIASVLKSRCTSCHQSTHDAPYLDLKHFRRLENGSMGFPHYDDNGKLVPASETLHEIAERLMTSDPEARMPYLSDMPSTERQALYTWASSQEEK